MYNVVFLIALLGCVYIYELSNIKIIGLARIHFVGLRRKYIIVDVFVIMEMDPIPFFIYRQLN